jgi:hypothetical protein
MLEKVEQLVVPVVGIHRHDGRAERVEGEEVEEELGAIFEKKGHPMAVTIPGCPIDLAQREAGLEGLLVGELDSVGVVGTPGGGRGAEKRVLGCGAGGLEKTSKTVAVTAGR